MAAPRNVKHPVSQSERYSKCVCQHCGGHIEFPSEGIGSTVPCPHCQFQTVLTASAPSKTVAVGGGLRTQKKILQLFFVAAIVVLAAGAGAFWYLQRGKNSEAPPSLPSPPAQTIQAPASPPKPVATEPPSDPWHGLTVGTISLEKASEGSLVYAVGKLRNASDHERFGVKIFLDVFDADGQKVGTATDYAESIQPGKEWRFKALVVDRGAASAKLANVKED